MRQVVCLSAHPWSSVPHRTQQLITRLKDAEVLYFGPPAHRGDKSWKEGGRRLRPGLIAYTLPPMLTSDPARGFLYRHEKKKVANFLRKRLERHRFRDPLLWCDCPSGAEYLEDIPHRGLVYDCDRDWPQFPQWWESDMATAADVSFAASPDLVRHLLPCSANAVLLPNGANHPMFAKDGLPRPDPLQDLTTPILGWVGTIRSDLELSPLLLTARALTNCTFVLVGEAEDSRQLKELLSLPNVRYVGFVPPLDVPDYLCSFDVCLSLLRRSGMDDDVIPTRMFEYLSSGRPIVTMLRPEQVENFPDVVYGAHTPGEFARLCAHALKETGTLARDRRREYGKAAAWSSRAEEVNRILSSIGLL